MLGRIALAGMKKGRMAAGGAADGDWILRHPEHVTHPIPNIAFDFAAWELACVDPNIIWPLSRRVYFPPQMGDDNSARSGPSIGCLGSLNNTGHWIG
jgi:hypothetical protein